MNERDLEILRRGDAMLIEHLKPTTKTNPFAILGVIVGVVQILARRELARLEAPAQDATR